MTGIGAGPRPPLTTATDWRVDELTHAPTCMGEGVLVSLRHGVVRAYRLDGRVRWNFSLPGPSEPCGARGRALALPDGTVLVAATDHLWRLAPDDGAVMAEASFSGFRLGRACVADGLLYLAHADFDEELRGTYRWCSYDLDTLAETGRFEELSDYVCGPMAVAAGVVAAPMGAAGTVLAVDLAAGKELWQLDVSEIGRFVHSDLGREEAGSVVGRLLSFEDGFVVPMRGSRVAYVDARTGALRWTTELPFLSPVNVTLSTEGTLHVLQAGVYCVLSAATGELLLEHAADPELAGIGVNRPGELVVTQDFVFGADESNGHTFCLHRDSGRLAWHQELGAEVPFCMPPVACTDRLFVTDWSGRLHVFKGADHGS